MGKSSGGGSSTPDPQIGEAALKNADLGAEYLSWMKQQANITNQWASQDRSRYQNEYVPLERDFIDKARTWDSWSRRQDRAAEARADVMASSALAEGQVERNLAASGVRPDSGRYEGTKRASGLRTALAAAGAENTARHAVEQEGMNLLGQAINVGNKYAVNPATSIGLSNNAASAGYQAAMQGQQSLANTLQNQWQIGNQANAQAQSALYGTIGNIAGLAGAAWIMSDEKAKTNKQSRSGLLKALDRMRIEAWTYKPGYGDGGRHVGPYAQDFTRETGLGDGKTINVIDAIGVSLGATKELSGLVKALHRRVDDLTKEKRAA